MFIFLKIMNKSHTLYRVFERLVNIYYTITFRSERVYKIKVNTTGQVIIMKLQVENYITKYPTVIMRRFGYCEHATSLALKNELEHGDNVLEIGAAYGYFSIQMAKFVGTGTVHSFEPSKTMFNYLYQNVQLNDLDNVVLHNSGLSDDARDIKISGGKKNTEKINDFLRSLDKDIDFIFIDADAQNLDGSELRLEYGLCYQIIEYIKSSNNRPKIFVEMKNEQAEVIAAFLKIGYAGYAITSRHRIYKPQ